jgi:hypothetical protein
MYLFVIAVVLYSKPKELANEWREMGGKVLNCVDFF